jgi:hypothetical protein
MVSYQRVVDSLKQLVLSWLLVHKSTRANRACDDGKRKAEKQKPGATR